MVGVCGIRILLWRVWVWGVPVVGCRQVLLFHFWEVSRMSMVVWDSTGLICKVNGYLSRMGFSSLDDYGRFSAVVWLRSFLDLVNLFWLKVLLVPVGVWSLGWSVGACRLWGRFEILYGYVNGALRFKLCHLWWDFYFALLCLNGCLGSVILLFKPAWFMLLVLWTLYSVSAFTFRAVSTKSCGVLFVFGLKLAILEFWRVGEQGERFPCFPGLVIMVCLNIIVLSTNWSRSRCMRCPAVAGDFGPVFVEGKAEYFK